MARRYQKVNVVRHQAVSVYIERIFSGVILPEVYIETKVFAFKECPGFVYPALDQMVRKVGEIIAWASWHHPMIVRVLLEPVRKTLQIDDGCSQSLVGISPPSPFLGFPLRPQFWSILGQKKPARLSGFFVCD